MEHLLYDERDYSNDSSSTEPPLLLANFLSRVKGYLLSYNNNYFRAKFGGGFEQQTVHPAMALSKPIRKIWCKTMFQSGLTDVTFTRKI